LFQRRVNIPAALLAMENGSWLFWTLLMKFIDG
jgi:hypothetical protein